MSRWPESFTGTRLFPDNVLLSPITLLTSLCSVAEASDGNLMGYMLGKAEGEGKLWHGHVSAVTVAPQYRRLGLAKVGYRNAPKTRCVSPTTSHPATDLD
jgi:ribosomal protein S18 acetylase RimI-like enzyme